MKIFLNQFGSYMKKEGNRFKVMSDKGNKEYSADKVTQILISRPAALSSGAVYLAMENLIDIVYLDFRGRPYARVYPCRLGGTTLTRKRQLEAVGDWKGAYLIKRFVEGKCKNQIYFLKALMKDRRSALLRGCIEKAEEQLEGISKLDAEKVYSLRDSLFGIEGFIASQYFKGLSSFLPFIRRDPDAEDPFNSVLNYGYGILYSEIEKACILAGLDPYLGFYHLDRYGKPCLVLDLIEEFRVPIVDRAVVTLFTRSEVNNKWFEEEGSRRLTAEGRKKIIEAIQQRLETKVSYRGKKFTLQGIIVEHARSLAQFLLENRKEYKPFIYKW